MGVNVYFRDANLNRVGGELDDWQSLEVEPQWAGVGYWQLSMPADHRLMPVALQSKAGVRIYLDGEPWFSGLMLTPKRDITSDSDRYILSGPSDSVWLNRRRCEPGLSTTAGSEVALSNGVAQQVSYLSQARDEQSGPTESVIKHYVTAALGTSAAAHRRLARFDVAIDRARGNAVTAGARFPLLLPTLQSIAVVGGNLGFGIQQVPGRRLEFDVFLPTDSRRSMVFSPDQGTLTSASYERGDPEANDVLVAGQGEGTARQFIHGQVDSSIDEWGLIEGELKDQRNTGVLDELYDSTDEEMAKAIEKLSLSFVAKETEARQYRRNWDVGHYATVKLPIGPKELRQTVTMSELIRSVKLSWANPNAKPKVEPFIGSPDAPHPEVTESIIRTRALATRTSRLEQI